MPKQALSGSLSFTYTPTTDEKVFGIRVEKSLNSDFKLNDDYSANGGYIISDASFWNQSERDINIKLQADYFRLNSLDTLTAFVKQQIAKL
jgi:hypothetical protein